MHHPDGFQIAVAFDQLLNTLFAGFADETLSSRAHRLSVERGRHWPKRIIDLLFFWQSEHCKTAYESELSRAHLPPEMRG